MADKAARPDATRAVPPPRGPGGFAMRIERASDARRALRRLLDYMRPFTVSIVLAMVLSTLGTVLGLLGPYFMGLAIDRTLKPGGDTAELARLSLLMVLAYVVSSAFQAVSARMVARTSQELLFEMRADLFAHVQSLPLRSFDARPAGDLMSRLTNDIDAINMAVAQNVTGIVTSIVGMVGVLVIMFTLNVWLTLAALLVVPVLLGFTGALAKLTRQSYRSLQAERGRLNGIVEENISGQRVVKAFRRKERALVDFRVANQAVFSSAVRAQSVALLLMPLTNALGNLFIVILAGVGSALAFYSLATVGTIAAFITYGHRFMEPLRQLGNMYNSAQAALAGAERIFEILDEKPEPPDAADASSLPDARGEVSFDHVNFSYTPGVPVIRDMTLEARPGQMIALVGPTGAGKTTLVNLLTRFYDVDSGAIRVDGVDIRQVKRNTLREHLGVVLQDSFLFTESVMDNIRYGRLNATDEECIHAAELAEADHFIRQLPQAYQTVLPERGGNLSQGQRQLLTIARAILADPAILVLDEATSSVDTRTERRIQEALRRLMKGRTSFVIAHRLATIRDADAVLVIRDGEIVERGTHDELLARRGFYHQLYVSQFKGRSI